MGAGSEGELDGGVSGLVGPPVSLPGAADTGNILSYAGLGALGSTSAHFTIDIERAPEAIADLKAAAEFLRSRAELARGLATVLAPGADGVSLHAAEQIGKWALDSGENNLYATLRAGAQQLEDLAAKLGEDLKSYLRVDELKLPQPSRGLPQ
ncbi:MAG: hypothetical protein ACRDTC_22385 [Pseudonocardiaceae bacterium]